MEGYWTAGTIETAPLVSLQSFYMSVQLDRRGKKGQFNLHILQKA